MIFHAEVSETLIKTVIYLTNICQLKKLSPNYIGLLQTWLLFIRKCKYVNLQY